MFPCKKEFFLNVSKKSIIVILSFSIFFLFSWDSALPSEAFSHSFSLFSI